MIETYWYEIKKPKHPSWKYPTPLKHSCLKHNKLKEVNIPWNLKQRDESSGALRQQEVVNGGAGLVMWRQRWQISLLLS